jgi:hypothetical protein
MTAGRSIRLFLVDGTPTGIITAEIMNWTGHVIIAPRSKLADFVQRQEAGRTGVYFLVGENPESALKPLVYIGETDNVGKRLVQHNKDDGKDFFDRFCVVTSKDQNLTKAHVRYLESRLITIAAKAGLSQMLNGTAPDFGLLPEADLSDMEFFIEQLRIVLPVLGLGLLREPPKASASAVSAVSVETEVVEASPLFELTSKKHGLSAEAREVGGEFVVLAGSKAQAEWIGVFSSYQTLHQQLVDTAILAPSEGGLRVFARDVSFNSPSAAAAIVYGRQANGRTSWHVKGSTQTYAAWQEAQIAARAPQGGEE